MTKPNDSGASEQEGARTLCPSCGSDDTATPSQNAVGNTHDCLRCGRDFSPAPSSAPQARAERRVITVQSARAIALAAVARAERERAEALANDSDSLPSDSPAAEARIEAAGVRWRVAEDGYWEPVEGEGRYSDADVSALVAEIVRLRAAEQGRAEVEAERDAALSLAKQAEEALKKFGQHDIGCFGGQSCCCGLNAALTTLSSPAPADPQDQTPTQEKP